MFEIRTATEKDIPALAHILVRSWQESYKGAVDQDWLEAQQEDEYQQKWQNWMKAEGWNVLLAENKEDGPVAFASFGKLKNPPPGMSPIRPLYAAEIYAIYILPQFWRQGIGTALMQAAAARLAEQKQKSLCLWTFEKNKRASAFYKQLGGERCGKREVTIGPTQLREICFGWRDTATLLP